MPTTELRVTLLSEATFTADSATTGAATTLAYVPGATLYGAAAAALAPGRAGALSRVAFFQAFVAGEVRFSDGLPEVSGEIALPCPLSLHGPKGGPSSGEAWNLARAERPGEQVEQLRGGFVTSSGHTFVPAVQRGLRTAVGPDGRARDRHLYGLATLPAGLTFRARLEGADAALVDRVRDALAGRVSLGRSRSAELGLAEIVVAAAPAVPVEHGKTDQFVLLCASDLALRDRDTGAPTLHLTAAALGLPSTYQILWDRTFVRSRRYSPFNGHRRRPELERQVIVAGSVITVQAPAAVERDEVRRWLANGVGEYRNQGLGQVLVDPTLLASARVPLCPAREPAADSLPLPNDALASWVAQQAATRRADEHAAEIVASLIEPLAEFRVSRAQWGTVRQIARTMRRAAAGPAALEDALRRHLDEGRTKEIWNVRRRGRTAADALQQSIRQARDECERHDGVALAAAVEALAARVARYQAQKEDR